MKPYLLYQLFGPLASWGDIAVGEVRPSFDRPSKSAVLGLVAAALGYTRDQTAEHQALASNLRFAVRLEHAGTYLHDYHTVQSPEGKQPARTRRDEVVFQETGTVLTYRDYYADMLALVCLWKSGDDGPSLECIAHHLRQPKFTLYLGRKSCPPALPLAPQVVEAGSIQEAFNQFGDFWPHFPRPQQVRVFWEGTPEAYGDPGATLMEVQRWDQPDSRVSTEWQFRPRTEYALTLKKPDDTNP
jgi:CRISPR system Cascade subunit CasD